MNITKTPEYAAWRNLKQRCQNPKNPKWIDYGGRGITVCDEWQQFSNFIRDVGPRPTPDSYIDRIDNDKGYAPGNVQWTTARKSVLNRRQSSKTPGVRKWKNGRYLARANLYGKEYHIGYFNTENEATQARKEWLAKNDH